MTDNDKNTFTVSVSGLALPDEVVERISSVVHQAALAELATLDLRGKDLVFSPIMNRMLEQAGDGEDGGGGSSGGGGGSGAGGGGGGGAHINIVSRRI